ncbi:unnamed protein product [Bursaphelenchus okinawaensis]|uniref:Uncharacterized protein n=1 Tax=Bursaphelenchus okinawaensis TaxID=465554 RepID=A0A811LF82_9BILA|nr:unnamed protein product [Bursaphelenchus okinawaensis]CAG9121921.1 unnamed protein product [Bursaphelenchus okinawaensis]
MQAHIVGKPSKSFYQSALQLTESENNIKFKPENIYMIGDDVRDDIIGAVDVGFNGILVKTGKFKPTDLDELPKERAVSVENFTSAVDLLVQKANLL